MPRLTAAGKGAPFGAPFSCPNRVQGSSGEVDPDAAVGNVAVWLHDEVAVFADLLHQGLSKVWQM